MEKDITTRKRWISWLNIRKWSLYKESYSYFSKFGFFVVQSANYPSKLTLRQWLIVGILNSEIPNIVTFNNTNYSRKVQLIILEIQQSKKVQYLKNAKLLFKFKGMRHRFNFQQILLLFAVLKLSPKLMHKLQMNYSKKRFLLVCYKDNSANFFLAIDRAKKRNFHLPL